MKNTSKFSIFFAFSLLFLVLGMSFFGMLNYFFNINIENSYIIVVTFFSIIFLIGVLRKKINIQINNYLRFFIILFIIVTFSFLFNSEGDFAQRKYLLFFCSGFLLTLFSSSIKVESYNFIYIQFIIYSIFNFIFLSALLINIQDVEIYRWTLIKEFNIDVIYFSRSLGLGIIASFFYFKNKIYLLIISISLFYLMYLLNEIGPILAVLVCILMFYSRKNKKYFFASTFLSLLLFINIITIYIPDLSIENIINDPRVEIYSRNAGYFTENPIIGIGVAGIIHEQGNYQSAHNIIIEIATEYGVLGLIPFMIMIFILFNKFINNKNLSFSYIWLYSFIIVQFSGDISLNGIFWFVSTVYMIIQKKDIKVIKSKFLFS